MTDHDDAPTPEGRQVSHTHWHYHGPAEHHEHAHADGFTGGHSHPHMHVEVSLEEFLGWLFGAGTEAPEPVDRLRAPVSGRSPQAGNTKN